jgi:hypothetical protein
MTGITLDPIDGKEMYVCDACGARCRPKDRNRFGKRHPMLCQERKAFTAQLAELPIGCPFPSPQSARTRSVDADDEAEERRKRWDLIDAALGRG